LPATFKKEDIKLFSIAGYMVAIRR